MSRKVGIVRFSALGDVAMTLPVVYDACISNPDVEFVVITRALPAGIFVNPPANLKVVAVDTSKWNGPPGLWRLAVKLRKEYEFDTWIDLHDVLRTKLLDFFMLISGVRVSVFKKMRKARKALTRTKKKCLHPLPSVASRYAEAFRCVGLELNRSFVSLDFKPDDLSAHLKPENEKWIGIAPFAAHQGKIYPLSLMREVVATLASQENVRIFIFGAGAKESAEIDALASGFPHVINMARMKLGLRSEMALMTKLNVMLTMDSANMHLASLVGTRVVSIWGATHPYCGFADEVQSASDNIQLDMTCRPCSVFGNRKCLRGDYHCLAGISPKTVVKRISEILEQ